MSVAPLRITYAPGNPDRAWAEIAGKTYRAESTAGAVFALCRVLVAAGLHDCRYEAWPQGRPHIGFSGPSVHAAARLTCKGTRIVPFSGSLGPTSESPVRSAA